MPLIELAPQHKHGLPLNNPLLNAAGILGFATEARGLVDLAQLGGFITNPLTWQARTPARGPNALLQKDGVVIHTGLPNPGVRAAVRRWGKDWSHLGPPIIVHLAATTPSDVARSLEVFEAARGVAGVELGLRDDVSQAEAVRVIRAAAGDLPLLVRLPLARAPELCAAAVQAGANALTVGAPPRLATDTMQGRFYSPTLLEQTLNTLAAVRAALGENTVPLIAASGLFTPAAAQAALNAGATAVQLDAVLWQHPNSLATFLQAIATL